MSVLLGQRCPTSIKKSSWYQDFFVLAWFLISSIVGGGFSGCVWTPEIHEREVSNLPPMVDYSKMVPDPNNVVLLTGPTVFSVAGAVTDPDDSLEDLYYWWFLDYRETQGPALFTGRGYNQIQIDPCVYPQLANSQKEHTIEVVIADPQGSLQYSPTKGRQINHAAVGVWIVKSKALCP